MQYCLPDELFNRVPYPTREADREFTTLDGLYREIAYKLPGAEELAVRKEVWHSFVDFCTRMGAYMERIEANSSQVALTSTQDSCKFLRVVGAEEWTDEDGGKFVPVSTTDFSIISGEGGVLYAVFKSSPQKCAVLISVRPGFDDETTNSGGTSWEPKAPKYMIDRYGECIAHGALARIYAMRGDSQMARMHATAYNNDLNRLAFGLITSGMRKHLLIDVEDWLVSTGGTAANGNG